jgi:hypothetical protein
MASVIALIALHDVGKFSRTFQAKVPELWPASLGPFADPSTVPSRSRWIVPVVTTTRQYSAMRTWCSSFQPSV